MTCSHCGPMMSFGVKVIESKKWTKCSLLSRTQGKKVILSMLPDALSFLQQQSTLARLKENTRTQNSLSFVTSGGTIIFHERGPYVFHSNGTFMKLVNYYRSPRNGLHNKVDIMRKSGDKTRIHMSTLGGFQSVPNSIYSSLPIKNIYLSIPA